MKWEVDSSSQYPMPIHLRTVSRSGVQIESRIFDIHKEAVLRAWWHKYENNLLEHSLKEAKNEQAHKSTRR